MGGDLTEAQQQVGKEAEREDGHQKAATHGGAEQLTPESRGRSGEHKNAQGRGNTVSELAPRGELAPGKGGVGAQEEVDQEPGKDEDKGTGTQAGPLAIAPDVDPHPADRQQKCIETRIDQR